MEILIMVSIEIIIIIAKIIIITIIIEIIISIIMETMQPKILLIIIMIFQWETKMMAFQGI
jgi:hypothetical protein